MTAQDPCEPHHRAGARVQLSYPSRPEDVDRHPFGAQRLGPRTLLQERDLGLVTVAGPAFDERLEHLLGATRTGRPRQREEEPQRPAGHAASLPKAPGRLSKELSSPQSPAEGLRPSYAD